MKCVRGRRRSHRHSRSLPVCGSVSTRRRRAAISKQAVQQLLDGLEAEGVLERLPDPRDGRGKLVRYTRKGLDALRDGDRIKLQIERGYVDRIGRERFAALMDALRALDAGRAAASETAAGVHDETSEST
ncbi:MarR family winged helix-turn-helix transcriptional regulator [Mesorhizobium sp.]|uniref:MarR family winged helix-turn-helix transcriptional regulator n=1 Tax=Mesorhizobium sp. TaxID=1871066 RepID=UPI0034558222